MKRLLVVLFGVLVFQGSVWAKCGDPADKESAKFLSPGQDSVLIKGAPFVVQWQDDAKYLCKKVKIELIEVSGNRKTKVLSHSEDNVGYFTLDKLMASVKDKTSAEKPRDRRKFEYQFRISSIKKACKGAPCKILSKSFTLANAELAIYRKAHGKGSQRDEAVVLATNEVRDALVRLTALEERLEELLSQDGQVAEGAVVTDDHAHPEYAHGLDFASLSHVHDNYAERNSVQAQLDDMNSRMAAAGVGGGDGGALEADDLGDSGVVAQEKPSAADDLGDSGEVAGGALEPPVGERVESSGDDDASVGEGEQGGGGSRVIILQEGTPWRDVAEANEHENPGLHACWRSVERLGGTMNPVFAKLFGGEGWAVWKWDDEAKGVNSRCYANRYYRVGGREWGRCGKNLDWGDMKATYRCR